MSGIIEFEKVSKKYKAGDADFFALRDVSLEIKSGEFIVILGPSGAGKSTLLNLIGGMDLPSSGRVSFEGKDISGLSSSGLADYRANNVGFVFQFYNLIPTLTAYENVALMHDVCRNSLDPEEVLVSVGLGNCLDKFPSQMSGGEQQRTSIARAICKNSKLLLCDEPTGALDTATGKEVIALIQRACREQGRTVVMVTHNEAITEIANKVIKVKNGRIVDAITNPNPGDASEVLG